MRRRTRYRKSEHSLSIDHHGLIRGTRLYPLYDTLENLADASLSSLRSAARQYCAAQVRDIMSVHWAAVPNDRFDLSATSPELVWLESDGERIWVVAENLKFDPPTAAVIDELTHDLVSDALIPHKGKLLSIKSHIGHPTDLSRVTVRFELPIRGATVGDAALIGNQIYYVLNQALSGAKWKTDALTALRRGQLAMLIGQPESEWMDAKDRPYQLEKDRGKLELAKDAAAFGNAAGGIIVLGLETRRVGSEDIIKRIRLFDLERFDTGRYRNILNHYVFPPITGLEINAVPVQGNRGFAYIQIPQQPPESKPLIVTGHLIEDRLSTAYLSVPVRAGDSVEFRNPASLHSLVVAGRVAVARAEQNLKSDSRDRDPEEPM